MTELDDRLVPKALELLEKFGFDATLTVESAGTFNHATNKVTGKSVSTQVRKISPPFPVEDKFIDGDVLKSGDQETYIANSGLTIVPVNGMKFIIDGEEWKSIQTDPLRSGQLIAAWRIRIRR